MMHRRRLRIGVRGGPTGSRRRGGDAGWCRPSGRLKGTLGFYELYLRLGAVFVWCQDAAGDARASSRINRSARRAVPERAARACVRCLRAT